MCGEVACGACLSRFLGYGACRRAGIFGELALAAPFDHPLAEITAPLGLRFQLEAITHISLLGYPYSVRVPPAFFRPQNLPRGVSETWAIHPRRKRTTPFSSWKNMFQFLQKTKSPLLAWQIPLARATCKASNGLLSASTPKDLPPKFTYKEL